MKVFLNDRFCSAVSVYRSFFQPDTAGAQLCDKAEIMTDEENRSLFIMTDLVHFLQALALKFRIPDGQYFVDDQDVGSQESRDGWPPS